MATKAKKLPVKKLTKEEVEAQEINKARTTLSSAVNAATVIDAYGKSVFGVQQGDINHVYDELSTSIEKVWDGDLRKCEGMLLAQASALQSIFVNLSRRAIVQEGLNQFDTYLRLALKAQSQSVRTIEALGELKNPRSVAFVKQANIAHGPQQVNNGIPPRAGESDMSQSKQSGECYELCQDARTPSLTSGVNPTLETVGEKHGAEVGRGKNESFAEQL